MKTKTNYPDIRRKDLIRHIPESAERVLDIGCSAGAFGMALKELRNIEVWGVEPDQDAASIASTRLDKVIVDFFSNETPLPNNYFDVITFNDSIEHMIDPEIALNIARLKLREGGRINCCVPNVRHIDNLEHLLIDKDWKYEEKGIRDKTHLRFFTKKSIEDIFIGLGFSVISIVGINEAWWNPKKRLRRILFKIFPKYFEDMKFIQYLVIAREANFTHQKNNV